MSEAAPPRRLLADAVGDDETDDDLAPFVPAKTAPGTVGGSGGSGAGGSVHVRCPFVLRKFGVGVTAQLTVSGAAGSGTCGGCM